MATGDLEYYLAKNPFYMAGVSSARNNANLDYSRMSPLEAALAGFVSGAGTGALTSYGRSQAQEEYNTDYNAYKDAMNSYLTSGDTSLIDALQGTNPFSQKAQEMREEMELNKLKESLMPKNNNKIMVSGADINKHLGANVVDDNQQYPLTISQADRVFKHNASNKGSGGSSSNKNKFYTREQAIEMGIPEDKVDLFIDKETGLIPQYMINDYAKNVGSKDNPNKFTQNRFLTITDNKIKDYTNLRDYNTKLSEIIKLLENALTQKSGKLGEIISKNAAAGAIEELTGIKANFNDKSLETYHNVVKRNFDKLGEFLAGKDDLGKEQNRKELSKLRKNLINLLKDKTQLLRNRLNTFEKSYRTGDFDKHLETKTAVKMFLNEQGIDVD